MNKHSVQRAALPATHSHSLHVTFLNVSLQMPSCGFSVCEVLRPELKELTEQACVFEGKNRVPHPLLQSPHPVLLRRRLCSLPLLSLQRRAKLRGQSVCKFPSSFPLSLLPCLSFPTPVHITLSFSL